MRLAAVSAALALLVTLALLVLLPRLQLREPAIGERSIRDYQLPDTVRLGGGFTLTDSHGRATSLTSLGGKAVLLAFGYTYCPDVCPTTLLELTKVLNALGPQREDVGAVFVTVDPERDTPAHLKAYLEHFHPQIVGLTGSGEEIRQVANLFGAVYEKVLVQGGDLHAVAHSSLVYLLDGSGRVRFALPYNAGPPLLLEGLRLILAGKV
jgi:protein SCO1/2